MKPHCLLASSDTYGLLTDVILSTICCGLIMVYNCGFITILDLFQRHASTSCYDSIMSMASHRVIGFKLTSLLSLLITN